MPAPKDAPAAPALTRVVETALYFDDLVAATAFYRDEVPEQLRGAEA